MVWSACALDCSPWAGPASLSHSRHNGIHEQGVNSILLHPSFGLLWRHAKNRAGHYVQRSELASLAGKIGLVLVHNRLCEEVMLYLTPQACCHAVGKGLLRQSSSVLSE